VQVKTISQKYGKGNELKSNKVPSYHEKGTQLCFKYSPEIKHLRRVEWKWYHVHPKKVPSCIFTFKAKRSQKKSQFSIEKLYKSNYFIAE
jgi:hypothetical protein